MLKDRCEIERKIKQAEEYIINHSELKKLKPDELLDYFENSNCELGVKWVVIALVVVDSLSWANLEELVDKLGSIESAELTKEYIGYILCQKHNVNIEELLLISDKMGLLNKILVYCGNNITFQEEFYEQNILEMSLLINRNLRENTSIYNLLLKYTKHIINFNKESFAFNTLNSCDFEFKNDILVRLSCSWIKKSKDDAYECIENLFKTSNEEKIKTALYLIKESHDEQKTFERFFEQILYFSKIFPNLRSILVSILTLYILENKNENKIYKSVLKDLRIYSRDKQNINAFIKTIEYQDEIKKELEEIFQDIIKTPVPDDESFKMIDTILYNNYKKKDHKNLLDQLILIYKVNEFKQEFEQFMDLFHLSFSIVPTNNIDVWEYIISVFSKKHSKDTFLAIGILIKKFKFDIEFTNKLGDSNKSISCQQVCRILRLLLYVHPIAETICKLYFELAPICNEYINDYISFGINEIYQSYPLTLSKYSNIRKDSKFIEIRIISEAINEYDINHRKESNEIYKIKDLLPNNERTTIIKKIKIEQGQKISKFSEEKSILSFVSKVHLKYGKRIGFTTRSANNTSEYSSHAPLTISNEFEFSKKYLIDPVKYCFDRIDALREVTEDETDN